MSRDTRDRILDALEELLLDEGSTKVTLEAVAAKAGVSKGGLLYHFNTKDAMIAAMVRRLGDRSDAQRAQAEQGGTTVAQWYLQPPETISEKEIDLFRSTLAVLRSIDGAPGEIQDAVTEVMRLWDEAIRAEITDPVAAEIVRLVGDGIYLNALMNLPGVEPELHQKVVERLLADDQVR
ncbi:TetR/AcrR family transcriptional regulator [Rhodococcus sp. BP-252]|uniref:TetR/AcrR family transcriptional regulator n=1 Tax=unclassified Rhodococcus (in: high G+C Gram-positive bacteria) TaxID=192944 RepID=UPI001C9B2D68|nr:MULTISPECIES: TetR/AcrR family transcriptional regulator [unclassified Rhodococcus (in: high G+C Gram-positive bacteria)]MBY6411328.1 TetR/AcrR family transcriptional regulator [Rhodococcus sp. BP-320]MBY6415987.1 TetR/AcrR family transcriptional regulator [Rhodococcus sp. BP-321]MBY6420504.1 TetR/AcrR family transcriptional regulator [Rhodococcus sp. BP-324]MBY6426194.1 TetR/AcrR family transcriptional regulator [Rhodococcus sp. BP-323]MBY6431265.1 TetR/AcrR family transcriptional regulato